MAHGIKSSWTDEREDAIKKLWADGLSASRIAAEIGLVSRNAVIGKLHRLGLTGADAPTTTSHKPRERRPNYSPRAKHAATAAKILAAREAQADLNANFYAEEIVDLTDEQRAKAVTFEQLNNTTHCKWPYGDPRKADFLFCGCDRIEDSSYCPPHHRIATRGK
jgi:GcrA cell cycle regulator